MSQIFLGPILSSQKKKKGPEGTGRKTSKLRLNATKKQVQVELSLS